MCKPTLNILVTSVVTSNFDPRITKMVHLLVSKSDINYFTCLSLTALHPMIVKKLLVLCSGIHVIPFKCLQFSLLQKYCLTALYKKNIITFIFYNYHYFLSNAKSVLQPRILLIKSTSLR